MNIVLFLGAGFSRAFGLPIMSEFFAFADRSDRITGADREFLGRLLLAARQANSFLESSPANLEDILSFAVMGERLGLRFDGEEEPGKRIRHILRQIYTHAGDLESFWSQFGQLTGLIGFHLEQRTHSLSFITTNYDLSIECALHQLNCRANPGFDIVQWQHDKGGRNSLYSADGLPVLKLHGSVNWHRSAVDESAIEINGHLNAQIVMRPGREPAEIAIPHAYTAREGAADSIIVPPSFLKAELPRALNQVWARAAAALETAHVVTFVGYSFPPTDTEMSYFLARSLMNNSTLRRINIVDTQANEIVRRLQGPDSRYGSHFKKLLSPHHGPWTQVRLTWD